MKKIILFSLVFFTTLAQAKELKMATYNIRNFRGDNLKTNMILLKKTLDEIDADVLAIQEIVDEVNFKLFIKRHYRGLGLAITNCGGSARQKLGFLYKKSKLDLLSFVEDSRISLGTGSCHVGIRPLAIAKFRLKKERSIFWALNVHLKAGSKPRSLEMRKKQHTVLTKILNEIDPRKDKKILVTGDFNTTGFITDYEQRKTFQKLVTKNKLYQNTRYVECSSYWQGEDQNDNTLVPSKLDHILVSNGWNKKITYRRTKVLAHCKKNHCLDTRADTIGNLYREVSDHCPIVSQVRW